MGAIKVHTHCPWLKCVTCGRSVLLLEHVCCLCAVMAEMGWLYLTFLLYTRIYHFLLQNGGTSLMWASREGHVECVKILIEGGAQVNQQNKVSSYRLVQCLVGDVYPCDMCGLWQ